MQRAIFLPGLFLLAGFVPGATASAHAGEADDRAQSSKESDTKRKERERLRGEVLDQMRAVRMWKVTQELKLDQATAAKLFPVLAKFDDESKAVAKERHEVARAVAQEAHAESPNDARLRSLIDRLQANQTHRRALEDERFKALRQALTPLQQAKLLLLLPRLEDDFRHRVREAIEAQRKSKSP
jgi:hypothetical protein